MRAAVALSASVLAHHLAHPRSRRRVPHTASGGAKHETTPWLSVVGNGTLPTSPARKLQAGPLCYISSLFTHLTSITTNPDCRAGCAGGSGACGEEWYPGAADACSKKCGRVFEPFWDECGGMLVDAKMGGMEEMGTFYDHCVESLYPPGTCGAFCNQHT
jgi:hypothetical protein